MQGSSADPPRDVFAGFNPDRPSAKLQDRSRGGYRSSSTFLVRWPDDSIGIMTSRSKNSLMMTLDEIADPGMALVKPYNGPLYIEIAPKGKIVTHCTLTESRLSRSGPARLMPLRRKKTKSTIGELFISGRFTDFVISAHRADGSGMEEIRCHKLHVRNLIPVAALLTQQSDATQIQLENVPHLMSGYVQLSLQYHYGVKLNWTLVEPVGLVVLPDDVPENDAARYAAIESNACKWIDSLVLLQRCAKTLGIEGLLEVSAQQMRRKVDGFTLHHTETLGIPSTEERARRERSFQRIPYGCRAIWNLAKKVSGTVKRLGQIMRNSVKYALPEEEAFVRAVNPTAEDLALYRRAQVCEYSADFEFSPSGYKAKLIGDIDDGSRVVESIEAELYPHRFYLKKLHEEREFGCYGDEEEEGEIDWDREMGKAMKLDEEYLESKTHYKANKKRIASGDDFLSQLMHRMNLTSPQVLAGMIAPTLGALVVGAKRARDQKDQSDEHEPAAKRQKTE